MKKLGIFAACLLVLGGVGYMFRQPIALTAVSLMMDMRYGEIGPTQQIDWAAEGPAPTSPEGQRPPNVVLILADDLGWNDLTFNGGGVAGGTVPTPNIDSIAADGAAFMNGYAANGTCAPSRAALMSGRYGTRFGFEFTPTPPGMSQLGALAPADPDHPRSPMVHDVEAIEFDEMGMPASEVTIAELLKSRGYFTAHIGKWHLGRANGMAPHDQGFDKSLLMASGLYLPEDSPDVVNSKQPFDNIDNFLWAALRFAAQYNGGPLFEPGGFLTDYYTDQAIEVIEKNKDRPFFLYLAHWAPHTPLQAPKADYEALDHISLHRERVYAAMISNLDHNVGRVLQALKDNGLDENTLVIFTSDNGGAGYIGLPDVNAPFRGWKITAFEGGIHVPFFAKWPAKIPAGTVKNDPVHHFDIYATAAAAAGAQLPSDRKMDGKNFVPYAVGQVPSGPHEKLFWRSGMSQSALVKGWKLNVSEMPDGSRKVWLFDLAKDPGERNNLADSQPEKLAELEAALAAHNAEQMEPRWGAQLSLPINIDRDLSQPDQPGDEFIYWSN